ncbi:MAG TPA: efflux RND transporter periplasmic adaptor subunit [Verrucomicrobiae bacterium]|nr:efflux RND transporter periplasmic adaptor subunit [Verrucomicrobiae bacterium]
MDSVPQTALKSAPAPAGASIARAAADSGTKLRNAAIVAGLLVVLGVVAGFLPRWKHERQLRAETKELAIQTVAITSPTTGQPTQELLLPAEIKPFIDSPIYARSSGYLTRWWVDIGAQVKQGDLLAELDAPELRQELAQAKAQLLQAEAALDLARTTAARWSELVKTESVSEQEAAEKMADRDLKAANVEAARANVRRLEELQSVSKIRAPFAGTITMRSVDVGQLVVAGSSRELFHLAQTATLRVYVHVPQGAAASIHEGQVAELMVPELPGQLFPAKVVRTAGAMSADSRTLLVELQVDNPRQEILADSYAQVRFKDAHMQSGYLLPSNTLLFRSEGTQVGVVSPDGKVELRKVSLGRDFGQTIEIIEGLKSADRVIVNPPDSLVNGAIVHVAEGDAKLADGK